MAFFEFHILKNSGGSENRNQGEKIEKKSP